jgi:hypothetical protein
MQELPDEQTPDEPASLRFLRRLVTVLTATMIFGVGLITVLLFLRLTQQTPDLALPGNIILPEGAQPLAITIAPNWYAVVTTNEDILIFARDTGELRQAITILPAE